MRFRRRRRTAALPASCGLHHRSNARPQRGRKAWPCRHDCDQFRVRGRRCAGICAARVFSPCISRGFCYRFESCIAQYISKPIVATRRILFQPLVNQRPYRRKDSCLARCRHACVRALAAPDSGPLFARRPRGPLAASVALDSLRSSAAVMCPRMLTCAFVEFAGEFLVRVRGFPCPMLAG
jgi:hypothetical protein